MRKVLKNPAMLLDRLCSRRAAIRRRQSYDIETNGERDLLARMREVRPKVLFDVGANVGDWTDLALREIPGAEVHCFEISEGTQATLEKRMVGKPVRVNRFGLSDVSGMVQFKDYGLNSVVNTMLVKSTFHDGTLRPTIRAAEVVRGIDYCRSLGIAGIDFLKIDVEGAEHMVLAGFDSMLSEGLIRVIQFEYGYANGDAKFLMRDFHEMFERRGYIVARVGTPPLKFRPWEYSDNNFESGPNYVAIRASDTQLRDILEQR